MAGFQNGHYSSDSHARHGVLAPIASCMTIDMLVNGEGNILLYHDQPLAGKLDWLEYDQDNNQLLLIFADGRIQCLGVPIAPEMGARLLGAQKAATVRVENGQYHYPRMVTVMVREKTFG